MARLKALDVYDDTVLLVLSDHGYMPGEVLTPRMEDAHWRPLSGNANPVLTVKPYGARGSLKSNPAEMSLLDVKGIVCGLTQACGNPRSRWDSPDPHRPRVFIGYEWEDRFWHALSLRNERRFEVRGPMFDPSSWREQQKRPVSAVTHLAFGATDRWNHFGSGWGPVRRYASGSECRWAFGDRASLFLNLPVEASSRLRFAVGALPDHPRQVVSFEVNGRLLLTAPVAGVYDEVSVVVPPGAADRETDEIVMHFRSHRPGGGEAERRKRLSRSLAVRFDELEIATGRR